MATLSVAICTYNRAELLPRALDSLLVQTLPADGFEIVVVDNGSTDSTPQLVADYADRHPRLRYVHEPIPGITHARNRAAREARGEYLAFLDDDAWAEPRWLEELLKATRSELSLACVVGPVELGWNGARPGWFPTRLEPLLCRYDMGSEPRFLGSDGYLLTTNAMFHRGIFLELGGFRPYLGRRRGQLLGGEDNDIHRRLVSAGHRVFYQPSARVYHGVPAERRTRRYLLRRLFWDGASQPLLALSQAQETGIVYRPWPEAYRDLRQCGRYALVLGGCLSRFRIGLAWESLLVLAQRLGRLRTHLALGTGLAG